MSSGGDHGPEFRFAIAQIGVVSQAALARAPIAGQHLCCAPLWLRLLLIPPASHRNREATCMTLDEQL